MMNPKYIPLRSRTPYMYQINHYQSFDHNPGHKRQTTTYTQDVEPTWKTMRIRVYSIGESASISATPNGNLRQTHAAFDQRKGNISTDYLLPQLIHKSALPPNKRTSSIRPFTRYLQTNRKMVHHLFKKKKNTPNAVKLPLHSITREGGIGRILQTWFK